jgi:hypothetical protein
MNDENSQNYKDEKNNKFVDRYGGREIKVTREYNPKLVIPNGFRFPRRECVECGKLFVSAFYNLCDKCREGK